MSSKMGGARLGAGRPKGALNKRTIAQGISLSALAQKHAPAAIAELVRVMHKSDSDAARVSAAVVILDRGYGKAPQAVDVRGHITTEQIDSTLPASDAARIYAASLADLESDTSESVH